ncbi:MAG: hypothetical protein ACERJ2_18940, partial [Filomicrobium sp.]
RPEKRAGVGFGRRSIFMTSEPFTLRGSAYFCDVRYGSLADIKLALGHVCFVPKPGIVARSYLSG